MLSTSHQNKVHNIQQQFHQWKSSKSSDRSAGFSLSSKRQTSNTIRSNPYKKQGPRLEIGDLDEVISVDLHQMTALVEPRVTMEKLVEKLLAQGVMPPVVPEFKGITVGGAINGTALESSSHQWGQFNDTCLSYEVLLGDGSIVHASANENRDLFYGISGSYGTLGAILSVELKVIPAAPWVILSYHPFSSIAEAVAFMSQCCHQSDPPDFVEALVFGKQAITVILGKLAQTIEKAVPRIRLDRPWSRWYYQHVKQVTEASTPPALYQDAMPLQDYLFRHDRAAFWMGAYALHSTMLARYFLDLLKICPKWYQKWQSSQSSSRYAKVKSPNVLQRALLGWMMPSQKLYALLHVGSETWFADRFVIQDFYLPESETAAFAQQVLQETSITPLWLCPVKATDTPQFFAPHFRKKATSPSLFFDVGVYGFPCGSLSATEATRLYEEVTQKKEGRKMLYGHSYYSSKEFWEIYPYEVYQQLRKQFHAEGVWKELHEKVLGK